MKVDKFYKVGLIGIKMKGFMTLGLSGVLFVVFFTGLVSAACSGDDNQLIFALSNNINAHGSVTESASYPVELCFSDFFEGTNGSSPDSRVLWFSAVTNAHARDPNLSPGGYLTEIKYGDLTCALVDDPVGLCADYNPGGEASSFIVSLSSDTNAHMAVSDWYQRRGGLSLCCASNLAAPICNFDNICEDGVGDNPSGNENEYNCPHDCGSTVLTLSRLDYQGSGMPLQEPNWIEVLPVEFDPNTGFGWAAGTVVDGEDGGDGGIEDDPLVNAKRDYHLVSGSEFRFSVDSISPVIYDVTIHSGSATISSGPFNITVEGDTNNEVVIADVVSTAAGEFVTSRGTVVVDDGELNILFGHDDGIDIAISGLIVSSFCGDGFVENPEECDDGIIDSGQNVGDCIIDTNPGGVMCQLNNKCGDGYLNSTEGCDDGNTAGGDGCSSECTLEDQSESCPDPVNFVWDDGSGGDYPTIQECEQINYFVGDEPLIGAYLCETCSASNNPRIPSTSGRHCEWVNDYCGEYSGEVGEVNECRYEIIGGYSCPENTQTHTDATVRRTGPGCDCPAGSENEDGEISCEVVETLPCPRVIQLPFFSFINFMITVIAIGLIYFFYLQKRK